MAGREGVCKGGVEGVFEGTRRLTNAVRLYRIGEEGLGIRVLGVGCIIGYRV